MSDIWSLEGPERFLGNLVTEAFHRPITFLRAPRTIATKIASPIRAKVRRETDISAISPNIPADTRLPPLRTLVSATPDLPLDDVSLDSFILRQSVPGRVYVVSQIPARFWEDWRVFLLNYSKKTESYADHPHLIVVTPLGISPREFERIGGPESIFTWQNVISKEDISRLAEKIAGRPNGILERFARATSIELAGQDITLLKILLSLDLRTQIDPLAHLTSKITSNIEAYPKGQPISWEEGVADLWSDDVCINTIRLIMDNRTGELTHRIWRAHLPIAMETSDIIRRSLIRRHRAVLDREVSRESPYVLNFGDRQRTKTKATELEIGDIRKINFDPDKEQMRGGRFLRGDDSYLSKLAKNMRHAAAHMEPVSRDDILEADRIWQRSALRYFAQGEVGWDWPRCGQKATVIIGPAGAGKSTWASRQSETVISRDKIRENAKEKNPNLAEGVILDSYLAQAIRVLKSGRDVVMDATHLEQHIRDRIRSMIPDDIEIDYIIIDRPLDEKKRDGGWRNALDKAGMIDEHHRIFLNALPSILNGDGDQRVRVIDLRSKHLIGATKELLTAD